MPSSLLPFCLPFLLFLHFLMSAIFKDQDLCVLIWSVVSDSFRPCGLQPHQAPLSRQEYWSGLPFPTPGNRSDPGIEPSSPALAGEFFTTEPPGKPKDQGRQLRILQDNSEWMLDLQGGKAVLNTDPQTLIGQEDARGKSLNSYEDLKVAIPWC